MSKCWYCNNELTSGDSPKHFGICNKCYDEMFRSGDTIISSFTNRISDLEAKLAESEKKYSELFCRNIELETLYSQKTALLNFYKDTDLVKGNEELQKQLEEKDKKIEILQTHFKKTQELLAREMGNSNIVIDNLQNEMKQALANQKEYYEKRLKFIAKDIMENIKQGLGFIINGKERIVCDGSMTEDKYIVAVLDTILKDYQK